MRTVSSSADLPRVTIAGLFERQVTRTPGVAAVVCGDSAVTYGGLNAGANRLARLLAGRGIGAEDRVAVALPRSVGLITVLLGILKAGAAYLPIDAGYPVGRIGYMLDDARPALFITTGAVAAGLPAGTARLLLDDPETVAALARCGDDNLGDQDRVTALTPDHPAYVIYTSGSTGTPKGVVVSNSNVVRLFTSTYENFRFSSSDVWVLFHSYSFDFSVWEIWGALLHGGKLVVASFEVTRSPALFLRFLQRNGVTVLNQIRQL
jgi:non-ribosomal peptide synthetase component F